MPRSNRPRRGGRPHPRDQDAPSRPLLRGQGSERTGDDEWHVRAVTGQGAAKAYRCPGCQQVITPGTPHVLAWPAGGRGGLDEGIAARRHWHRSCWQARAHRRPR